MEKVSTASPKIYSVSECVHYIREILREKIGHILIQGEVSNFQISQGKFVFFNLKDKDSVISCFLMKNKLRTLLEDGMEIKILGVPQLFVKSGKFHIAVEEVELVGEGSLQKAYIALRKKLEKEGLFDVKHKRALPQFPEKIGIITSETAAAYTDVLRILKNRWSGLEIKLIPVKVQGIGAHTQIVEALDYLNTHPIVNVVILTRGGGSLEDLQAFNHEDVARAVFGSKLPVICAVGHERDESLADFVADVRASTPSNAAEIVVPDKKEVIRIINTLQNQIEEKQKEIIINHMKNIQTILQRMTGRIQERVQGGVNEIKNKIEIIEGVVVKEIELTKERIDASVRLIKNLDPKMLLKKGYTLTWSSKKKLVKTYKEGIVGEVLLTQFSDGNITSKIISNKKL